MVVFLECYVRRDQRARFRDVWRHAYYDAMDLSVEEVKARWFSGGKQHIKRDMPLSENQEIKENKKFEENRAIEEEDQEQSLPRAHSPDKSQHGGSLATKQDDENSEYDKD